MRRNRICSGTLACLIAWAALAVSVMAAEDTGSTMRVLEVKEAEQVLVRVIAADGTTITGEIGMLSWSQQNMGEDLAAEQQQRTEPAGPFVAQATGEEGASSVFDPQPSPTPFLSFGESITFSIEDQWLQSLQPVETGGAKKEPELKEGTLLLVTINEAGQATKVSLVEIKECVS